MVHKSDCVKTCQELQGRNSLCCCVYCYKKEERSVTLVFQDFYRKKYSKKSILSWQQNRNHLAIDRERNQS